MVSYASTPRLTEGVRAWQWYVTEACVRYGSFLDCHNIGGKDFLDDGGAINASTLENGLSVSLVTA
jgi:hypothetical protein